MNNGLKETRKKVRRYYDRVGTLNIEHRVLGHVYDPKLFTVWYHTRVDDE